MNKIKNKKSAVILNPERSEWVSGSHETSVEFVVNDGAKNKARHALKRSLRPLACGSRLKMTFFTLAALLSTGIASESWAINCPTGTQGSDNADASNYCGVNCCWGIDNSTHTLTITPALGSDNKPYTNVTMADFSRTASTGNMNSTYRSEFASAAPWARQGVTSVVVENGISNIGNNAFIGETIITSVTGMENVTSIGEQAFNRISLLENVDMPNVISIGSGAFVYTSSLQSVDMPNVTSIGNSAFLGASSLQSVDMPKVEEIGNSAFSGASSLGYFGFDPTNVNIGNYAFNNTKINGCGTGDNYVNCNYCTNSTTNSNISSDTTIYQPNTTGGSCITASECTGEYMVSGGLCKKNPTQSTPTTPTGGDSGDSQEQQVPQQVTAASCANSGKVLQGTECVSTCGASFRLNDGECDRIRYTPAEAAQYLKDTDNEIIMTFKVNR